MDYKIIAMDFDGTLLTSNKKVTENTKNTLLKLEIYNRWSNGKEFIKR